MTDNEWSERNHMLKWVREVGRNLNMVLTIKNSWETKVLLACVLAGEYKPKKKGKSGVNMPTLQVGDDLKEKPRSRKMGCPFELVGQRDRRTHHWRLSVKSGRRNHDLSTSLDGYPFADRLTDEQKEDARILTLSHGAPKFVMTYLREKWSDITTSMR